jgi:hypothetical protein
MKLLKLFQVGLIITLVEDKKILMHFYSWAPNFFLAVCISMAYNNSNTDHLLKVYLAPFKRQAHPVAIKC